MRRAPIVNEAVRMLGEADGIDDEFPVLVPSDGFTEPTGLRIQAMLSVQIDATHEMIPLPENPNLLRRLNEIDGLGREEHLGWTARPTAGHRAEGAAAVLHQFIVRRQPRASDWGFRHWKAVR